MTEDMNQAEPRLAEAIRARRIELGMNTIQDLVNATGLTRQGLQPLLDGEIRRYQDRLKIPVCTALRWTHDSIDRIIAGLEPVENGIEPDRPAMFSELKGLQGEVDLLREQLEQLAEVARAYLSAEIAQAAGAPPDAAATGASGTGG